MGAAKDYADCEVWLLAERGKTLNEQDEADLLDMMDELWWKMTNAEHDEANRRAEAYNKTSRTE